MMHRTQPATTPATSSAEVAMAFVDAVTAGDIEELRALLADDVWCRAMLVREVVERHTADETAALFHAWFATPEEVAVVDTAHHTAAGREHVRWRMHLRPEWAPSRWHLIEQTGYVAVADGRIRRIDLACTGFHAVP